MKRKLIEYLTCPADNFEPLELYVFEAQEADRHEIVEGLIFCPKCFRWYAIRDQIPEMLPDLLRKKVADLPFLKKWKAMIPEKIVFGGKPFSLKRLESGNDDNTITSQKIDSKPLHSRVVEIGDNENMLKLQLRRLQEKLEAFEKEDPANVRVQLQVLAKKLGAMSVSELKATPVKGTLGQLYKELLIIKLRLKLLNPDEI